MTRELAAWGLGLCLLAAVSADYPRAADLPTRKGGLGEINGDFNSAYTVATTSHSDLGSKGTPRDTVTKIEAKWLGACKPDQKPGDIIMPGGGFKLNVKDMDKLKALLPGG